MTPVASPGSAPRRSIRSILRAALPLLLGFAVFLWWTGGHVLPPTRVGWLMMGLDTPSQYLGWQFFRHTPWLQWPLGANPAYGSDAPSSIVFADTVPLFALFFKLFAHGLPAEFQYFGLWIACCFMLQAWFAHRWLDQAGIGYWPALLASALFACAPLFLVRACLHPALTAQWTVLAAFCLCGRPAFSARRWLVLLVLTTLIHAYLLLMLAALWVADLARRRWLCELRWRDIGWNAAATALAVLPVMWAAGYFYAVVVITHPARSYANLLTPLSPGFMDAWSSLIRAQVGPLSLAPLGHLLLPHLDLAFGEGFAYAGMGILLLAMVAVLVCAFRRTRAQGIVERACPWWFVLAACLAMAVYACGPRVYAGSTLVFSYPSLAVAERIYDVFRAAGRMIWPLWYFALFATLCALARRMSRNGLAALLSMALLVQVADLWGMAAWNRHDIQRHEPGIPPLASPLWQQFAAHYRRLVFMPNAGIAQDMLGWLPTYKQLAELAAQQPDLSIGSAYTARMDPAFYERQRLRRSSMLMAGQSEPGTLYVIEDDPLWNRLACSASPALTLGVLDGKHVIAPGWDRSSAIAAGMQAAACDPPR